VPIREFKDGDFLLTCTRGGTVKRTPLSAYSNIRATGIIAVGLAPDDALLGAKVVQAGQDVIIGTGRGMSIRFNVDDVRPMGRDARGVRGIELREGDRAIGMDVIQSDDQQVLTVSANGYGKRTPVSEWRVQGRGGIGIIAMDTSERNGAVVNLCLVTAQEQFMCITNGGQVIRTAVSEVREVGRNTQGVRVMTLDESERVVDVAKLAEDEVDPRRTAGVAGEEPPVSASEGGEEPRADTETDTAAGADEEAPVESSEGEGEGEEPSADDSEGGEPEN
jgi:DNA gyrase subunit A